MKKILSIILALTMVLVPAASAFAKEPVVETKISGNSRLYLTTDSGYAEDSVKFYYDESYFVDADPSEYNPSLATLSMLASISALGRNDSSVAYSGYYDGYEYEGFLKALGVDEGSIEVSEDFIAEDYELNGSNDEYCADHKDSFGAVCALKTLSNGDKLLIVIGRGTSDLDEGDAVASLSELASEFTWGKSGDSQGIEEAASKMYTFVYNYYLSHKDYFADMQDGCNEVKLWITGYGRGGSAANIAAAKYFNGAHWTWYADFDESNIFAYTFDSSNTAYCKDDAAEEEAKGYTYIHNIVNPANIFTYLAPSEWGFTRYGTDETVVLIERTEENKALFEKAADYASDMYFSELYLDDNKHFSYENFQDVDVVCDEDTVDMIYKSIVSSTKWDWDVFVEYPEDGMNVEQHLNALVTKWARACGSRKVYVQTYQSLVRDVFSLIGQEEGDMLSECWDLICDRFEAEFSDDEGGFDEDSLIYYILHPVAFNDMFVDVINDSLRDAGLNAEDYENLSAALLTVGTCLNYGLVTMLAQGGQDEVVTFVCNVLNILDSGSVFICSPICVYQPTLILSWLMAEDPNYAEAEAEGAAKNIPDSIKSSAEVIVDAVFKDGETISDANLAATAVKRTDYNDDESYNKAVIEAQKQVYVDVAVHLAELGVSREQYQDDASYELAKQQLVIAVKALIDGKIAESSDETALKAAEAEDAIKIEDYDGDVEAWEKAKAEASEKVLADAKTAAEDACIEEEAKKAAADAKKAAAEDTTIEDGTVGEVHVYVDKVEESFTVFGQKFTYTTKKVSIEAENAACIRYKVSDGLSNYSFVDEEGEAFTSLIVPSEIIVEVVDLNGNVSYFRCNPETRN